jgi:acetoin utilization deacetylase AcuC-like enzyme
LTPARAARFLGKRASRSNAENGARREWIRAAAPRFFSLPMTLLYYDPLLLEHDTGPGHPERRARLTAIVSHLEATGLWDRCRQTEWQPASDERIARVHRLDYVDRMRSFASAGGGRIEADTVVSRRSYDAAVLAAGAACDAAQRVLRGEDRSALCLVRPPGHHALAGGAMGFCLLNNVAVAARAAIAQHQLDRVLVVDFDVHHGNGTQDAFYVDEQVALLSIHRWPFYPGTGSDDETGSGPGLGTIVNLPIRFGTQWDDYLAAYRRGLERLAERVRPQLVLASAGFDAHRLDPIGSLGLETEHFAALTDAILDVADVHAGGRVVSLLEGGYNTDVLGPSVATHLECLLAREVRGA